MENSKEVSVARALLTNSWKQVSTETNKAICKPITALGKAKQTLCESSTVSVETNIATHQHIKTMREAIKVPCELKTASAMAIWIAKTVVPCKARDRSFDSASCEVKIVSDCKTISALHRVSREARAKALCANNEATAAPLTSSALLSSARLAASDKTKALSAKDLNREVKNEAPLSANSEAISASLTGRTSATKLSSPSKAELKQ